MKIDSIDIEATIEKARRLVNEDKNLSTATQSMFEIMILIIDEKTGLRVQGPGVFQIENHGSSHEQVRNNRMNPFS